MLSARYGDLRTIAAKSNGSCHLCGVRVNLRFYGRTGLYGKRTVTVDHLTPQSLGGTDEPENLRLAHGTCNSVRGAGPVELTRLLLGGPIEPQGASASLRARFKASAKSYYRRPREENGGQPLASGVLALGAGIIASKPDAAGVRQFNWTAAAVTLLACGVLAALED